MKKKKINLPAILVMVGSAVVGGVCGVLMVKMLDSWSQDMGFGAFMLSIAGLLVGMYAVNIIHIAAHEAGHLVFGLLTGYRFSSYRLGSLMLVKENGKLRLRKLSIPGTGGQCLMVPPELVDGKMPYALYNLGGCIANVVLCLVFLLGWLLLPAGIWKILMMLGVVFGLILALSNGIPLRLGMVDNDGYNALSLGKDPQALRALWVQLKVVEQTAAGVRLKDMPQEWFAVPECSSSQSSLTAAIAVFAVNRLMDEKRFREARAQMERLVAEDSGMTDLHRNLLRCDLICCELMGENRREMVDGLMTKEQTKFMQAMKTNISILRAEYVYALLGQGDLRRAEELLKQFQKRAKSHPYTCEVESEWELIELAGQVWHQRCEIG